MSNESNSSLFTILLANTKDVFTSILSYFILAGNKFTLNIALGLIISTLGAVMFSSKSIYDNMITSKSKRIPNPLDSEKNKCALTDDSEIQGKIIRGRHCF